MSHSTCHCPSAQVMMVTYLCYVRARDLSRTPQHLRCRRLSFAEVQTLCRYRLGWHDLQVQRGRYGGVDRSQRVCTVCTRPDAEGRVHAGPVEDLQHFLLQCPALQHVRDRYPDMFMPTCISAPEADAHVRYILNHSKQKRVAELLLLLLLLLFTAWIHRPTTVTTPTSGTRNSETRAARTSTGTHA
jgi:hypothetical protein